VNVVKTRKDVNEAFVSADIFMKRRLYESPSRNFILSVIPLIELPGIYEEQSTPFFGKQESFAALYFAVGQNL